ncbi:hypothetical protein [Candidatus Chlamydia sanziniae]|uniref:hypothetical protein n=1 Tax=Candidatus Chlamydia sanziniae TaxID=1806891 RepID=UPI0008356CCE|nr:hypothetical protein [Candidatus Chlamydia sanziniae]
MSTVLLPIIIVSILLRVALLIIGAGRSQKPDLSKINQITLLTPGTQGISYKIALEPLGMPITTLLGSKSGMSNLCIKHKYVKIFQCKISMFVSQHYGINSYFHILIAT